MRSIHIIAAAVAALFIATVGTTAHAEQLGHCDIEYNQATNNWDSKTCTTAELRKMATIYGTPPAPERISRSQERQERIQDEDRADARRDREVDRAVAVDDHIFDRNLKARRTLEKDAWGRALVGAIVVPFAEAGAARLCGDNCYGGYYGGYNRRGYSLGRPGAPSERTGVGGGYTINGQYDPNGAYSRFTNGY